jgi:hypothetical protein
MSSTPTQAATGVSLQDTMAGGALRNPYPPSTRVSDSGPRTQVPVTPQAPPVPPPFDYGDGRDAETLDTNATRALGVTNAAVESTTVDTTAARVETSFGSEYNSVYTKPDDPDQILLDQLRPLIGQPDHHRTYLDLKDAQVTFCKANKKQHDKMTKMSTSGFTLRSMALSKFTLVLPTGHEDDTAYTTALEDLKLEFEAAKATFQARTVDLVEQSTELQILFAQKQNGKIFLTRLDAIANSGAITNREMWNSRHPLNKCLYPIDGIRWMAVQQLLKVSPHKGNWKHGSAFRIYRTYTTKWCFLVHLLLTGLIKRHNTVHWILLRRI